MLWLYRAESMYLEEKNHSTETGHTIHVKQLFITNYGTNQCDILEAFFGNTQSAA